MCAIAGLIGLFYDEHIVNNMLCTMLRRGPDGNGCYAFRNCALLHTRLAIIDLENGAQPMELQWQDENYILTYNGELYNTQQLRVTLESYGHKFKTRSDTEVVLHAYAQWKEKALERMNGIFAFAVWEEKGERLFVARDRIGVKPLFYKQHEDGFLFASEIKTILAYPTVRPEVDADGIGEIILLGPGRTPGSGVFKNIQELEPGCYGYYSQGNWVVTRYWKLTDREHAETFAETAEHIRWLVTDAIKKQMVSDVPVGAFLSGGLDSSLICGICAQEKKKENAVLQTFSVDYVDNEKYFVSGKFQPEMDNTYISIMQKFLNSDHHLTQLTPQSLLDELDTATQARDLPGMADVDFSLLAFCKKIRSKVKVALSGECADEIFGGYPWYRDPEIRSREGFPWAQNTAYRADFLHPAIRQQLDPQEFVMSRYYQTVDSSDVLPGTNPEERRMKEMVNLNHTWFMQTLLDRKDRMSMYCGLEVRVPFCDYRIAEYMYGVPWEYKNFKNTEKGLLRYAMDGVIPQEILYRKKSPYPKTYDPQYTALVSNMLRRLIEQNDAPIHQVVQKEVLEKILNWDSVWPWYGQLMRGPQTIAYMLQINRWLEQYKVILV